MPLTVDWSRLDPPITEPEMDGAAFNVGVALLLVGVPHLKDDAAVREVVTRLAFYERLYGPYATGADSTTLNTVTRWKRWKSVRVNATPMTRAQFVKSQSQRLFERLDRIIPIEGRDDGC